MKSLVKDYWGSMLIQRVAILEPTSLNQVFHVLPLSHSPLRRPIQRNSLCCTTWREHYEPPCNIVAHGAVAHLYWHQCCCVAPSLPPIDTPNIDFLHVNHLISFKSLLPHQVHVNFYLGAHKFPLLIDFTLHKVSPLVILFGLFLDFHIGVHYGCHFVLIVEVLEFDEVILILEALVAFKPAF